MTLEVVEADNKIKQTIEKYWKNTKYWYTVEDVAKEVKALWGKELSSKILRAYMKNILNLSYKKAAPCPFMINDDRHRKLKEMFAIEFGELSKKVEVFMSVIEASFSYLTRFNRTWTKKGQQDYVKSINF